MKFDPSIKKDAILTKRIQVLRQNKDKVILAIRNKLIKKKGKSSGDSKPKTQKATTKK